MKPVTWSISNLELFELCPKKYFHLRVKKDVKDKGSAAGNYGSEAHKHFEQRLVNGKKLPLDLRHHEKVLMKLEAAPGEGLGEQKLALNKDFEPTGFFDADVWVRGIVDYTKFNGSHLLIVDHKFGRMKDNFDQLKLMAAMLLAYMPEIESVTAMYYWAKNKKITSINLTREDLPGIWETFLPRVERLKRALTNAEFEAKPNYLCANYCPVNSCAHCGG